MKKGLISLNSFFFSGNMNENVSWCVCLTLCVVAGELLIYIDDIYKIKLHEYTLTSRIYFFAERVCVPEVYPCIFVYHGCIYFLINIHNMNEYKTLTKRFIHLMLYVKQCPLFPVKGLHDKMNLRFC